MMKRYDMLAFILIMPLFVTGFTLENAIVPQADIPSGGPPKDGIPAINDPKFIRLVFVDPQVHELFAVG